MDAILDFLSHRAIPGVEQVDGTRYHRTIRIGGFAGILELDLSPGKDHVLLRLRVDDPRSLGGVVARCRHLLDLDVDPSAVGSVLAEDPLLQPLLARRPGLRVPGAFDGWEMAVRAVLGQQISVTGARTAATRLVQRLGTPLAEPEGSLTHLFPGPEHVAEADLDGIGIPARRVDTLRALARTVASGEVVLDRGSDREEVSARLMSLPGIGPWTVSTIAMRALGDPDAFPAGDLGVRQALEREGLPVTPAEIGRRAEAWRPWRAYAAIHLWTSLGDGTRSGT